MSLLERQSHKLRRYIILSWVVPGSLAVSTVIIGFLLFGWTDFENARKRLLTDLVAKAEVASKRIGAELVLGELGFTEPMSKSLQQELSLQRVWIEKSSDICGPSIPKFCRQILGETEVVFYKIPYTDFISYVGVSHKSESFWNHLRVSPLIWMAIPVLIMLSMGITFQSYLLRRFMVEPVSQLVTAVERKIPIPEHWPFELKEIALLLAISSDEREQAMFAGLVHGVLHDISTFIHSVLIATELVDENKNNLLTRGTQLEFLHKASAANLPKIKRIIERTFDGSKDVRVYPTRQILKDTILDSIDTTQELANSANVDVQFHIFESNLHLPFDAIQLERAFVNILKNSIEAISSREKTSEVKGIVSVQVETTDGFVEISIHDNGPGFEKPSSQTFQPTRSRKLNGCGLGLYIAGKIVRAHGGIILAGNSLELGGALVQIKLPVQKQAEVMTS